MFRFGKYFLIVQLSFLNVNGLAFFPFIFLKKGKNSKVLINHERIHLRQQVELLILPFYLWYIVEYFWHYYQSKNHHKAYRSISFEREAYAEDNNLDYLKHRPWLAFWKYIKLN
jgi:hypothetical protein